MYYGEEVVIHAVELDIYFLKKCFKMSIYVFT